MVSVNRVLLCIMDGWGISKGASKYDATKLAPAVNVPKLLKEWPSTKIHADGEYVGLPAGQMGNSEVGHLNIGAGRVVYQDLMKINRAIDDGSFFKNERFLGAMDHAKKNNSALHLYGLVSTGGVHSSLDHLVALIQMAKQEGLSKVYVHAFLDGRDTPPSSACEYLQTVEDELAKHSLPPVASAIGRYYIMDRDNRWDRVEKGYNCLTLGEGEKAASIIEGVKKSYANGVTDEFVLPIIKGGEETRIHDNDSIIFFNYRPDRAVEITKAFLFSNFNGSDPKQGFDRKKTVDNIYYCTMTNYDESFDCPVAFMKDKLINKLGDVLVQYGIKQFRTAETEKFNHITKFMNGIELEPQPHEERVLVSSPKVPTYDMQPEMSAYPVRDNVLQAIKNKEYGFILVNFANPDMVGHTGNLEAAAKACKVVDECVGQIADECIKNDVTMILTADHGNAEVMFDEKTGKPHTAHTTNEVPFAVINPPYPIELKNSGALCDIAPTTLQLMGLKQPAEMTGSSMIKTLAIV